MFPRLVAVLVCIAAGAALAGCGVQTHETRTEKRFIKICSQYVAENTDRADDLCRCEWDVVSAEVPAREMDMFFFKITAGSRFDTKEARLLRRATEQCLAKLDLRDD